MSGFPLLSLTQLVTWRGVMYQLNLNLCFVPALAASDAIQVTVLLVEEHGKKKLVQRVLHKERACVLLDESFCCGC